jgi:hypothetical protein
VSATVTGFTPNGSVANLSVTSAGQNVALPSGTVIKVTNTGPNNAHIKLSVGAGSAATTDDVLVPGAAVGLTVGSNTYINAITASTETASLNITGGSGLVSGYGGGSGTGSGGAVTIVDGGDVAEGAKADAAYTGSGSASVVAALKGIYASSIGSIPAGTNLMGYVSADPCSQATKLGAPVSLTASGRVITGTSAKKTYICSIDLITASTQNIALVEGTGSTCATNIFGLAGGTTAGAGWNLVANGGLTKGSGAGTVYSPSADSNATAADTCLLLSGSGQTSGQITYVQQ